MSALDTFLGTPATPTTPAQPKALGSFLSAPAPTPKATPALDAFTAPLQPGQSAFKPTAPLITPTLQKTGIETSTPATTPSKALADNTPAGVAKNTITGLIPAAGKVAQYLYQQGISQIVPGATKEELSPTYLATKVAPEVVPSIEKLGAQIAQHPVTAAAQVGQGTALGALDSLSRMMMYIPGLVPQGEQKGTLEALHNTFVEHLFPEGQQDIGKGFEQGGGAAIPIVASALGGAVAAPLGEAAAFAGGTAGFAATGQLSMPTDATLQERAQNALDSLVQQGLFTAGTAGFHLAKGMLVEGAKNAYHAAAANMPSSADMQRGFVKIPGLGGKEAPKPEEKPVDIEVPPMTRALADMSEKRSAENAPINQLEHDEPQASPTSGEVNPAHVDEYIKQFGNEVNTDNARELFASYRADRSTSADVHEPASDIAKAAYAKLLEDKKGQGNNTVLFTAGGTGAGKSSALRDAGVDTKQYPVIYDTNLNNEKSAAKKIGQALDAGYQVHINYVHNDVHTSLDNAMNRAERMAQEKGSGRTVPVDTHYETHTGSPDAFVALAERYKDEPNVKFRAVDNEGNKKGGFVENPIDFINEKVYNKGNESETKTKLQQQVTEAHAQGRISEQTKNGFLPSGLRQSEGSSSGEALTRGASETSPERTGSNKNRESNGSGTQESTGDQQLAPSKLDPKSALVDMANTAKSSRNFAMSLTQDEANRVQATFPTLPPKEAADAFYSYVKENIAPAEKAAPEPAKPARAAKPPAAQHIAEPAKISQARAEAARAETKTDSRPSNQTDSYSNTIEEHNGGVKPPENKGGMTPPEIDWTEAKDIAAIRQSTDTMERTLEKIFPKQDAAKLNEFLTQADRHNEAERARYVTDLRQETKKYVVDKLGIKQATVKSALVQRFGEGRLSLDELKAESPKDWQNIKAASDYFRGKYDELIDRWNAERARAGLKLIPKRTNYFRHFMDLSGWAHIYGIDFKEMDIPTELSGISMFFRSQSPWTNAAMRRLGSETTDDAIGGFDNYLNSVSKAIYHTDTVQRGRLVESYVRAAAKGNSEARMNAEGDKEAPPPIKLPRFAQTMKAWTDKVSGKQNIFDRSFEAMVGRPSLAVMRALTRQFGLNVIGGNVSASVTHAIPMVYTLATVDKGAAFHSLVDAMQSPFLEDFNKVEGQKSDFLARRFSTQEIQRTLGEHAAAVLSSPFHAVDQFISRFAVAAKYYEGISKGLTPEKAMLNADNYASRVIGDRSSGNLPPIMSTKTLGWLTQFQIEVNDNLRVLMHDIPHWEEGNKTRIASRLVQFAIFSFLFNQTMQHIKGSGKGLDPIDLGLTLAGLNSEGHDQTLVDRFKLMGADLLKELPFTSVPTGGQVPAFQPIQTAITDALTGSPMKGLPGLLASFASPIGGGMQFQKTMGAIDAWRKGYVTDSTGRITATIPHTLPTLFQGALFGKNAFPGVKQSSQEVTNLDATIKSDQAANKIKTTQARNMAQELEGMPQADAAKQFDQIAASDPEMAKKIVTALKDINMGMTKSDSLVKQLGVANGERAKYIASQLNDLPDKASKGKLWEHLVSVKVLTPDVATQIIPLLNQ